MATPITFTFLSALFVLTSVGVVTSRSVTNSSRVHRMTEKPD